MIGISDGRTRWRSLRAKLVYVLLLSGSIEGALGAEHSDSDRIGQSVQLEFALERESFEAREPVIARVTLTNHGTEPLELRVRSDGAPYAISVMSRIADEPFIANSLWLRRVGPKFHGITLSSGETTTGEVLVLMGHEAGFVFPKPGVYQVKCRWSPENGYPRIETDVVTVSVSRSSPINVSFLRRLDAFASEFFGRVRPTAALLDDADYKMESAILLLSRVISQTRPRWIEPENGRQTALIKELRTLLREHGDSYYAGYIARYLGLVHVKSFEHDLSVAGEPSLTHPPDHPHYLAALEYLTFAESRPLWPRAAATYDRCILHVMGQEWSAVEDCIEKLRSEFAHNNGPLRAQELASQYERFKKKLARRAKPR